MVTKLKNNKIKLKIKFLSDVFILWIENNLSYETFESTIKDICRISFEEKCTFKWVDDEGDPCTISSLIELEEAINVTNENEDNEMCVYVFNGQPIIPGMPCKNEVDNIYRKGAKRWKKFYYNNGHRFYSKNPTYKIQCIVCKTYIWGISLQGYQCTDCKIFVHKKCHSNVNYKCKPNTVATEKDTCTRYFSSNQAFFNEFNFDKENITPKNINSFSKCISNHRNSENHILKVTGSSNKITLDDFNLLTVIGRGSYAKVVQAEHKKTKNIYAIKIIKKDMFNSDEDSDWTQTEKSIFELASNHPFLVGLHSCFQTDLRLFFVIEFAPGGDLMYHMQRRRKLPEDHVRFYAAEIVLALHFLHYNGIIYRDLKLDNVLIDSTGHIKLTDYGMCKTNIGPGDYTNTFCGTPNYIAPEILRGENYNFSIDWWALGVLMYEMMVGRSPFDVYEMDPNSTQTAEEYLFQVILEKQIVIPRILSVKAGNVLRCFLNKFPNERLGCNTNLEIGLDQIKNNVFFKNFIDWGMLEAKQIQPPYDPQIQSDRDLQHFDKEFTDEGPNLTIDDPNIITSINQTEFEGFEYVNPLLMAKEDSV
uniref:Protein kinase C n=1 Tax=Strongyloides venezuelensis TaxID=75913 RepID=A0A0K0FC25_STRVS